MTDLVKSDQAVKALSVHGMCERDVMKNAHDKAVALKEMVIATKTFKKIGQKSHLMVEAWETCGEFYGIFAQVESVREVTIMGQKGIEAKAVLYDKDGRIAGGGIGTVFEDEPQWANKQVYARVGMAQTRAISRALRHRLAWVVVMAGFNPTPAEEMTFANGDQTSLEATSTTISTNQGIASAIGCTFGKNKGKKWVDFDKKGLWFYATYFEKKLKEDPQNQYCSEWKAALTTIRGEIDLRDAADEQGEHNYGT